MTQARDFDIPEIGWHTEEANRKTMIGTQVLLVGRSTHRATSLLQFLAKRGCGVRVAENCKQALALLNQQHFELVLSELMLADGSAEQLLEPLCGTRAHMFFANALEDQSWWLHVLNQGENHWWKASAIPPERFFDLLGRYVRQAQEGPAQNPPHMNEFTQNGKPLSVSTSTE